VNQRLFATRAIDSLAARHHTRAIFRRTIRADIQAVDPFGSWINWRVTQLIAMRRTGCFRLFAVSACVWVIQPKRVTQFVSKDIFCFKCGCIEHNTTQIGKPSNRKVTTRNVARVKDRDRISKGISLQCRGRFCVVKDFAMSSIIFPTDIPHHKHNPRHTKHFVQVANVRPHRVEARDRATVNATNHRRDLNVERVRIGIALFSGFGITTTPTSQYKRIRQFFCLWHFPTDDLLVQAIRRTTIARHQIAIVALLTIVFFAISTERRARLSCAYTSLTLVIDPTV
jgi:hypothetical protein